MTYKRWSAWLAAVIAVVTVLMPMSGMTAQAQSAVEEIFTQTITYSQSAAEELIGDVNGDGKINVIDSIMLFSFVSGRKLLTVAQQRRADVRADGVVNVMDSVTLFRIVSGGGTTTTATTTTTRVFPTSTTAPTGVTAVLGIDVSYAQETINWSAVKETEVSFAILRCGYGDDEPGQQDEYWEQNAAACEELDIPYGAYFFCYARNAEEAAREAQHALRLLEGKNLTLPIFLDMEYSTWQGDLTPEQYAEVATVFCDTVGAAGYKVGVYSNLDWWNNRLTDPCFDRWYRWMAQYHDENEYQGTFHIWQYSDSGTVDGIPGIAVDMNYCYTDFTTLVDMT